MTRRLPGILFLAAAALAAATGVAAAQPSCNLQGERLMSWPTVNPVWQFCFLRPQRQLSGTNGSGLEIRDVYYNGHLVMKRGHVPMLNVQYDPGGCGCYRDWQNQEVVFHANNVDLAGIRRADRAAADGLRPGGSAGTVGTARRPIASWASPPRSWTIV